MPITTSVIDDNPSADYNPSSVATSSAKAFRNYITSQGASAIEAGQAELDEAGVLTPELKAMYAQVDPLNREEVSKALSQMASLKKSTRDDNKGKELYKSILQTEIDKLGPAPTPVQLEQAKAKAKNAAISKGKEDLSISQLTGLRTRLTDGSGKAGVMTLDDKIKLAQETAKAKADYKESGGSTTAIQDAVSKYNTAKQNYNNKAAELKQDGVIDNADTLILQGLFQKVDNAQAQAANAGVKKTFLTSVENPEDIRAGLVKTKGDETKEQVSMRKEAVKIVNDQVEKVKNKSVEFVKKKVAVEKAVSQLNSIREKYGKMSEVPAAAFFTAIKSLSNVIEPGLSVTEGEVNGFLGSTDATNFVVNADATLDVVKSFFAASEKAEEEANKMGLRKIPVKQLTEILALADQLNQGVLTTFNNAINAGRSNMSNNVKGDLTDIYTDSIDPKVLETIKSRIDSKFELMDTGKPAPKPKPKPAPVKDEEDWRIVTQGGRKYNVLYKDGKPTSEYKEIK